MAKKCFGFRSNKNWKKFFLSIHFVVSFFVCFCFIVKWTVFALTHLPKPGTSKTGFGQVKIKWKKLKQKTSWICDNGMRKAKLNPTKNKITDVYLPGCKPISEINILHFSLFAIFYTYIYLSFWSKILMYEHISNR